MTEFIEAVFESGTVNSPIPVMNNVFIYASPTLTGNPNSYSVGLINALVSRLIDIAGESKTFVSYWQDILSASIAIKNLRVRNLYNDLDFDEISFLGAIGVQMSDALAPTSALSYRAARARTGRNRWRKRYSGIPESQFNRGVLNPLGTYAEAIERFGQAQQTIVDGTDGDTVRFYTPVVLYNEVIEFEGQKFYRRPLTALTAEGLFEPVSGIEYSTNLSTQNTRRLPSAYVPSTT